MRRALSLSGCLLAVFFVGFAVVSSQRGARRSDRSNFD